MKRTRTIRVNGKSGLKLTIAFSVEPDRMLTRDEQERVLEAVTDNLHHACLADVPYHTVHTSDVKISP